MENSANKKILYIEDDFFIGQMYSDFLTKNGYTVTVATDGTEGLAKARTGQYNLILLDLMLPGISGQQILANLKGEQDLIPDSKIIVLTNYQQPDQVRQQIEGKVEAYLTKTDLMPSELLKLVKQIIG